MLGFTPISAAPIAANNTLTAAIVGSVSATGSVGEVSLVTDQRLAQTGLVATTSVGSVAVTVGTGVSVVAGSSEATTAVGSVSVTAGTGTAVTVEGVEASGDLTQVTVIGDANVPQTGLEATSSVGTVTQRTTAVIPVVNVPGARGRVGTATVIGTSTHTVEGVEATGQVGRVLVWGQIIPPTDDDVWTEITIAA